MYSTMHPVAMNPLRIHYFCNYGSAVDIHSPPPEDCDVLDLSTKSLKREASPDYTYCYPSPKSSPNSHSDHPYGVTTNSPKTSIISNEKDIDSDLSSPSHSISPIHSDHISSTCCSLPSPGSPRSPDALSETTSEASFQINVTDTSPKSKRRKTRPFKTIGKDSALYSVGAIEQLDTTSSSSFNIDISGLGPEVTKRLMEESAQRYAEFKEKMLMQLHNNNNITNLNMRRLQNNANRIHDPEYIEKRRKNNEAAKKSRDARRYKQDEIAIRATYLEQENILLKFKVKSEIEDLQRLRSMELSKNS